MENLVIKFSFWHNGKEYHDGLKGEGVVDNSKFDACFAATRELCADILQAVKELEKDGERPDSYSPDPSRMPFTDDKAAVDWIRREMVFQSYYLYVDKRGAAMRIADKWFRAPSPIGLASWLYWKLEGGKARAVHELVH